MTFLGFGLFYFSTLVTAPVAGGSAVMVDQPVVQAVSTATAPVMVADASVPPPSRTPVPAQPAPVTPPPAPIAAAPAPVAPPAPVAAAPVPEVPAINSAAAASAGGAPTDLLSKKDSALTRKEKNGVELAGHWKDGDTPVAGQGGRLTYRFGASLPTIVCAPLYVCAVELQAGETVNNINIGDSVRWIITPATTGTGANQAIHVIIKPTDIGLTTNMIISTDRRVYVLKLVSHKDEWMPVVSFSYPEDEAAAWALITAAKNVARQQTVMADTGQNLDRLDFGFQLSGDSPSWRPVRVYTDGVKTYIQFPHTMRYGDAPVLVGLANDGGLFTDPTNQIINYRISGDRFVVDKVLSRAALVDGVGSDQVKVVIERTGQP